MARLNNGEKKSGKEVTLLNANEFLFELDGKTLNMEDATDAQFDRFIRRHIEMCWSLEDRVDAVNTALEKGKTMGVMSAKPDEEAREKSNQSLIFSGTTPAQEGSLQQS